MTDWADVRVAAAAEAVLLAAPRLSDRPAAELPEHEPTADELLAVQWLNDPDVEELIASINLRCALQPGHPHQLKTDPAPDSSGPEQRTPQLESAL